ncbi:hypothetical protein GT347_25875 [Xylophilus rhododendri]|uniref:Transmembrane protein n=1 Tax=Xylophilus rhododendri TaxID=2697032 RepID=A0A857JDS8_9BURK|nr:DUF6622 family protein [Xylophilus rhododendri]QHJ01113.1 hypothetical protein GT347_25875 [Xylophilus rhododendri]
MASLSNVLAHTPAWVFGLFLLLFWMGLRQWRGGTVPLARAVVLPLGMACLSLYGALQALSGMPVALLGWAVAAALAFAAMSRTALPAGVRWEPAERAFRIPGSAVPLALTMAIFFTKFAAGYTLATHAELRHDGTLLCLLGLAYGAFSGLFAGRAARLLRLARRGTTALNA